MKVLFHLLLILCFWVPEVLSAQVDIPVPEKQIPIVSKVSASWCPYCGTWGWDFMEALMEDNNAGSNIVTLHYSGDYRSKAAADMTSNFGAFGQPQFFLNSDQISVNASTISDSREEVKASINANGALAPIAQTGILAGPHEGQLNIITKTHFFQEASGEYFLGLYLLEKAFSGPQAGRSGNALHKNVLRTSLMPSTFGKLLATGNIAGGTDVILQQSVNLSELTLDLDKVRLLSIIWKKEDTKYQVVNTNVTEQFTSGVTLLPTVNRPLRSADFQLSVQPNVVSDFSLLKLILPSQRKQFRIELWSPEGRKVQDIFQGPLGAGMHQWTIDRSEVPAAGMYFLRLHDGTGQASQAIIFR